MQSLCDSLSKLIHSQPRNDNQPQVIQLFSDRTPFVLHSPHADQGVDTDTCAVLHWGLLPLLSYMNVDRMIEILGYLLREMKVIIVCDDPTRLSSCMITLSALLWPLKWAGPIVINLPPFLADYLDVGARLAEDVVFLAKMHHFVGSCSNILWPRSIATRLRAIQYHSFDSSRQRNQQNM